MTTITCVPDARWILGAWMALTAFAQEPVLAEAGGRQTAASCENLVSISLPDTRITLAQPVAAGAFTAPPPPFGPPPDYSRLPRFCRVTATIAPVPDSEIKIEVWLPVEGWNGKFVGVGNGGFSGDIPHFMMGNPLQAGYAVAATNTGHDGGGADASFAVGHPEKLTDFGWRAVHELAVKAKAIITAHYGRAPRLAYWTGCSSGGRQGLKEAQRFPADFDGIIAGAPAHNFMPLLAYATQVQRVMTDTAIRLTGRHLNLIKSAMLSACDANDGVTDSVVENPRRCAFDVGSLACSATNAQNCLNPRQLDAVRSLYAGAVNTRAGTTLMPGPSQGGEPLWQAFTPRAFPIGANYFRDMVVRDASWTPAMFDMDRDLARALADDPAELMTTKTDLRAYIARGGKLLLWHGWTDAMIPARSTIEYYEAVLAASGREASNAVKLFMLPGVDHCAGGEGADVFDALQAIDAWVDRGQAPERIVASRPLPAGASRTRALCPYPMIARYRGTGSTDEERNFECVR